MMDCGNRAQVEVAQFRQPGLEFGSPVANARTSMGDGVIIPRRERDMSGWDILIDRISEGVRS